jgi:hypothetical protein
VFGIWRCGLQQGFWSSERVLYVGGTDWNVFTVFVQSEELSVQICFGTCRSVCSQLEN